MKKIVTMGVLVMALSVAMSAVVMANTLQVGPSHGALKKNFSDVIETRMNMGKNPAPFDKVKAPLSGIANMLLTNRELLQRTGIDQHIDIHRSKGRKSGTSQNVLTPGIRHIRFNKEVGNMPQNEQTIATWTPRPGRPTLVVGGSNDYRGFYGLLGDGVSGYYVSSNNGTGVTREGSLPHLVGTTDEGNSMDIPSMGDPVLAVDKHSGVFYYASLYIGYPTSAIGLARATPADLKNKYLPDNKVWNVTKVVANDMSNYFHDKPWMTVDNSATSQYKGHIYVTWTAFTYSSSKIWMARCDPGTFKCVVIANDTNPVSENQLYTQWSKVSVDDQGRVIITWQEIDPNMPTVDPPYYHLNLWYRVYAPGGITALTPPVLVTTLDKPVTTYYASQSNEFRIPTAAWNEPAVANGVPRLFIIYQTCNGDYLYDFPGYSYADSCSNIDINLTYVDNYQLGSSVSSPIGIETSAKRHGYFPTMSVNQPKGVIDIVWYMSGYGYKHTYYIAMEQRNITSPSVLTKPMSKKFASDPDADEWFYPYGAFIGDYFQVVTEPGTPSRMYIHYTGNPRYTPPFTYVDPYYGDTFLIGGNGQDNMLYTKTYS